MERVRFGASVAVVATAGIALAGLLIAGAGLVHSCGEFGAFGDACDRGRGSNLGFGTTYLLTGLGTLALAAVVRARLALVRRVLIGGAAAAFPVPPAGPAAPGEQATPDLAAQLSRLSGLHAAGHLTNQEFDQAKQKLLANDPNQALPEPGEVGHTAPEPQSSGQATAEHGVSVARYGTDKPIAIMRSNQSNILGTLSLVSGVASLLLCVMLRFLIVPFPSLVAGIVAVTLGVLSLRRFQQGRASNRGQAIAGLVCGAFGTVLSAVLLGIYLFAVD